MIIVGVVVAVFLLGLYAGYAWGAFKEWSRITKYLIDIGELEVAEEISMDRYRA